MLSARSVHVLAAARMLLVPALFAQTGATSPVRTIAISATKLASVGITLPAGGALTLPGGLSSGINDFMPLPFTTSWSVDPAQTASVAVVAFFEVPARALINGGSAIPSMAIWGRVATGTRTGFLPFTQVSLTGNGSIVGSTGGSLLLVSEPISTGNARGERTDQLQLRIDLKGLPPLPAGTYAGTLNLVAVTQ